MHSAAIAESPSGSARQPAIASPTGADDRVGLGIAFEQLDACPEAGLPLSNLIVCGIADGSPAAQSGGIEVSSAATAFTEMYPDILRPVIIFTHRISGAAGRLGTSSWRLIYKKWREWTGRWSRASCSASLDRSSG